MQGTEVISKQKSDASTSKPSKSQKKKAKKTAAKAQKETSQTALFQGLNPHQQLRTKLLAEGFTEKQVDDAMEAMWSRNLAYDDFDAVCEFLRSDGKDNDAAQCSHLSEQTTQSNLEEENTTTSTAASTVAAAMTPPSEGDFVLGFSPVEEEKEGDYDSSGNSRNAANAQAPSLAAKLEMVARYENLVDAAFALSEWTTKAAKPHEVRVDVGRHPSTPLNDKDGTRVRVLKPRYVGIYHSYWFLQIFVVYHRSRNYVTLREVRPFRLSFAAQLSVTISRCLIGRFCLQCSS
jgi:hypothetical protein